MQLTTHVFSPQHERLSDFPPIRETKLCMLLLILNEDPLY